MKKLKYVLYAILGIIVIIFLLALVIPQDYKLERSISIEASEQLVVNQLAMFKNFQQWSPWSKLDPEMKMTIDGDDGQVGAVYRWSGNKDVGTGSMKITNREKNRVDMVLEFLEPWESTAETYFTWKQDNENTNVVWGMTGKNPIPLNVFFNMDKMVGPDYEKGLTGLKDRCETIQKKITYNGYTIEELELPGKNYLMKKATVNMNEIPGFIQSSFTQLMVDVQKNGTQMEGPPASVYFEWDEENQITSMAAAIPCSNPIDGYDWMPLGGKAIKTEYKGAYEDMMPAYTAMSDYMMEKGLQGSVAIEEYLTDPETEPDTSQWLTNIYFVLK